MKRYLRSLLVGFMVLSLAVSGYTIPVSAASSKSEAKEWDSDTEQSYEYKEDDITLVETELVRISARELTYKSTNKGMALRLTAKVENLSDEHIRIVTYPEGTYATGCNFTVEAGDTVSKAITGPVYDWNCQVGDTDVCFQGGYLLKVISESNKAESVQFDWFASENKPFMNISTVKSVDYGADLEYFNFRTSAEMTEFMQQYIPDALPEWGDTKWQIGSDSVALVGSLTPDKEHFTGLSASVRSGNNKNKMSEEEVAEALLSFYDDFSDKTGLFFDGAEECISEKLFPEEGTEVYTFNSEGYELTVYCREKSSDLYFSKEHREYGEIPYSIDDALAYMQSVGGEEAKSSRTVEFGHRRSSVQEPHYYAYVTLDDNERVISVDAEYDMSFAGDEDKTKQNELARAFFEDLASFFLNGKVKEEALEYIEERYESDPDSNTVYRIGWDYTADLSFARDNSKFSIDVNSGSVPRDAEVFPDEKEQEALRIDPITRRGIDKDIEVPETVLLEQDNMRIVLERACYTTDNLVLVIRMENIPDDLGAGVRLEELNGSELWKWEDTQGTVGSAYLGDEEPHEPVEADTIWISIRDIQKNIPDFSGISALQLNAYCSRHSASNGSEEKIGSTQVLIETKN